MITSLSKWLSAVVLAVSLSQVAFPSPSAIATTDLYPFTSFTFTNVGVTGNTGPTLSQFLTAYDTSTNVWLKDTNYFNATAGIQLWTVPKTGTYQITAAGAQGVPATSTSGGLGAIMQGTFSLTQGTKYRILVGQTTTAAAGRTGLSSAGGGGTFVVMSGSNTVADILIIAGGGGGTSLANRNSGSNAVPESTTAKSSSDGYSGGSNGNKGSTGNSNNGAGGGFLTGGDGLSSNNPDGMSFIAGGKGGYPEPLYSNKGGGFGGGGSVTNGSNARFSGGGGFNGGGATASILTSDTRTANYGGGGSSFNRGTNQTNSVGNLGSGYVTIELVIPQSSITISSPNTGTYGMALTITATVSVEGKVTFYAREKRIPGCINVQTSSLVATCQYKVGTRNSVGISATLRPTDTTYASSSAPTKFLAISNRATRR